MRVLRLETSTKTYTLLGFFQKKDMELILKMALWNFNRNLVIIEKIKNYKNPNMVDLSKCPFWVRIYDLLISQRTKTVAVCIANTIGEYMK